MRPILLATFFAIGTIAHADEASKNAKIEEMFRIVKIDQMQQQMMDNMKGTLRNMFEQPGVPPEVKASRKELEDEVFAFIEKKVSWQVMKVPFLKIYAETMTEDEIDSIVAFYKTPAGKALLEKMPVLMKRGMEEVVQPQMKTLLPEMQQMIEKFTERHKTK